MNLNPRRSVRPWYAILLAAMAAGVIIFGITQLGTPTTSAARTSTEEVAAENGVVQTTVSGSGEVEPGVDDTLNFATSGTLQSVDVKVGEHVKKGQLIATLDPSSAELTLESARASLTSAEDNLTEVEDGTSTGSSSNGVSGASNSSASSSQQTATAASATTEYAAFLMPADLTTTGTTTTTTPTTTTPTTSTTTTTTTPVTTTATSTVTAPITTVTKTSPTKTSTTPISTKTPTSAKTPTSNKTPTSTKKPTSTTKTSTSTTIKKPASSNSVKSSTTASSGSTPTATSTTTTKPTAAQIQQAQVQVDEAKATVTADEKAVAETKLYAPASGTIASLSSDSIGQTVSSGNAASSAASQSAAAGSSTGATGTSSSSSSGFAELINDKTMTMTVSLSEDDISNVKVGQMATVSITALSGVELAGRVSSISPLGTDSSGVVSYDATITVTQSNSKVFPGMSATASIVTGQAQGVTVPNDAITGTGSDASVQLVSNGKTTTQAVVVGLRGSSRSQIVSGLKAGQDVKITITLPALGTSTTSSSSSSSTSGLGGRFGGAGGFTGGGGTGLGGIRAFFGGGGGG